MNTCSQKSVFYKKKQYFSTKISPLTISPSTISCRNTPFNWVENIEQIIRASKTPENTPVIVTLVKNSKINYEKDADEDSVDYEKKEYKDSNADEDSDADEDSVDYEKNADEDSDVDEKNADDTEFYRLINKICWCDKDEGLRSVHGVTRALNNVERIYIIHKMNNIYIPQLRDSLLSITAFDGLSHSQQLNMFAHIIGKGKVFNEGIQQNPDVSIYLIDQYYDLYTYLHC
jgi:hypothetical protein